MHNFKAVKIAEYRHREHGAAGRLYGMTPELVGPRTYAQSRQRWRIVSTVITNGPLDAQGRRPAHLLEMDLTKGGRDRLPYSEAIVAAHRQTDELVKATPGVIDQHYTLYVLIPATELAAKKAAKARRRR